MVLTCSTYIFSAYKIVEVVECLYTACSFSVTLHIFEDSLSISYFRLFKSLSTMHRNTLTLKKKNQIKLQIREIAIKEGINKPRRNMDGQVTTDGED